MSHATPEAGPRPRRPRVQPGRTLHSAPPDGLGESQAQTVATATTAPRTGEDEDAVAAALAAFLRTLAERARSDPALARTLLAVLRESGASGPHNGSLLPVAAHEPTRDAGGPADAPLAEPAAPAAARPRAARPTARLGLDPFAELRDGGEARLRAALAQLDLLTLRQVVRAHRLDPARLSARWTAHTRLIELIVEQVRARANLGRAFERV